MELFISGSELFNDTNNTEPKKILLNIAKFHKLFKKFPHYWFNRSQYFIILMYAIGLSGKPWFVIFCLRGLVKDFSQLRQALKTVVTWVNVEFENMAIKLHCNPWHVSMCDTEFLVMNIPCFKVFCSLLVFDSRQLSFWFVLV